MRRAMAVLAVAAVVAVAAPVVAGHLNQREGRIDRQTFAWTNEEASTSSPEWQDIPGLSEISPSNCFTGSNAVSAQASLRLERGGAPVGVRVAMRPLTVIGELKPMRPGAVTVDGGSPIDGADVMSFTFVHGNPPSAHGTTYSVQWRSPTGAPVTMTKGTLTVLWDFQKGLCI